MDSRQNAEALEELRWKKFPVLSDGFVTLVDCMGDDAAIVQAARVSYGAGTKSVSDDETLIRYLMRMYHSTPFEQCQLKFMLRIPMDAHRQHVRHRTFCLAGDTKLVFDLPGGIRRRGNQAYNLTLKQIYERFQPTVNKSNPNLQGNPYFKRDRIQNMQLRCLDENTQTPTHTNIVDIWQTGVKSVYEVSTQSGSKLKMSEDHLCLFDTGWSKLKDRVKLSKRETCKFSEGAGIMSIGVIKGVGLPPALNQIEPETEQWVGIPEWEDYYQVSSQGRVRRIVGGKGSRSVGRCKAITISNGRSVVSLNRPGEQVVYQVHRMMLRAFQGPPQDSSYECCHYDGNSLNNVLDNLRWGTSQDNSNDQIRHKTTTYMRAALDSIVSVAYMGEVMTYDIEVAGPHHNFVANGLVVHNSINEYSTRYSEAIDSCDVTDPTRWRSQSTSNKQGSGQYLSDWPESWKTSDPNEYHTPAGPIRASGERAINTERCEIHSLGEYLTVQEERLHILAHQIYQERLEAGVAREQARKDLTLSTYTELYWCGNLHNLLHYLKLRMDSHAQLEIRSYANIIGHEIVAKLFPASWRAFCDYRLNAMSLSATDQKCLRTMLSTLSRSDIQHDLDTCFLNKREREEFVSKLCKIGLLEQEN